MKDFAWSSSACSLSFPGVWSLTPSNNIKGVMDAGLQPDENKLMAGRVPLPATLKGSPSPASTSSQSNSITLQFLLDFASNVPRSLTTAEVVSQYKLPQTVAQTCSYGSTSLGCVGQLPTYVIHSWQAPFHQLVSALRDYCICELEIHPQSFHIWLSVFCFDQHRIRRTELLSAVRRNVVQSGKCLLMVDCSFLVFRRAWCLFELWTVITEKGPGSLEILGCSSRCSCFPCIGDTTQVALDVSTSQATDDLAALLLRDFFDAAGTPENVNSRIVNTLLDVLSTSLQGAIAKHANRSSLRLAVLLRKHAAIRAMLADYDGAQKLLRQGLELLEHMLGSESLALAYMISQLACVLHSKGEVLETEELLQRSYQLVKQAPDAPVVDLIAATSNLALIMRRTNVVESTALFSRCFAMSEASVGNAHPVTAAAADALGVALMVQGNAAAGAVLLARAVALRTQLLGPHHPSTADSHYNLGLVLDKLSQWEQAAAHYWRAATIRNSCLGSDHPATACALNNLGVVLHEQGELMSSQPCYDWALRLRQRILGVDHRDTLDTQYNYFVLLRQMGRLVEARELLYDAACKVEAALVRLHVAHADPTEHAELEEMLALIISELEHVEQEVEVSEPVDLLHGQDAIASLSGLPSDGAPLSAGCVERMLIATGNLHSLETSMMSLKQESSFGKDDETAQALDEEEEAWRSRKTQ